MTQEERTARARALHRQGCNCCQAVVMAYADALPIGERDAMNMSAPFGRGMSGMREVCGCVSGMALVCGLAGRSDQVRTLAERFRESNGDVVCGRLLQMGKKPCTELVAEAAGLLADVVR